MALKILIAAGGSGGHIFPAQALAELLKEHQIHFAGHGLSKNPFLKKDLFPFSEISSHNLSRPFSFFKALTRGFKESLQLLRTFSPDVVVGFGSFHTVPVLLAALFLRKRIVLYEANASLGKVNALFAPFSKAVASQFPLRNAKLVPFYPWKPVHRPSKEEAMKAYGFDRGKPVFLIFGGSQGADFLNDTLLIRQGQVLHFTGKGGVQKVKKEYEKWGVLAVVKEFESTMPLAYAAADIAICRSGAGTVAELICFQIPALLIPYPHAYNHQEKNAKFFVETVKGGYFLTQAEATFDACSKKIQELLQNKDSFQSELSSFNQTQNKRVALDALVASVGNV